MLKRLDGEGINSVPGQANQWYQKKHNVLISIKEYVQYNQWSLGSVQASH